MSTVETDLAERLADAERQIDQLTDALADVLQRQIEYQTMLARTVCQVGDALRLLVGPDAVARALGKASPRPERHLHAVK